MFTCIHDRNPRKKEEDAWIKLEHDAEDKIFIGTIRPQVIAVHNFTTFGKCLASSDRIDPALHV